MCFFLHPMCSCTHINCICNKTTGWMRMNVTDAHGALERKKWSKTKTATKCWIKPIVNAIYRVAPISFHEMDIFSELSASSFDLLSSHKFNNCRIVAENILMIINLLYASPKCVRVCQPYFGTHIPSTSTI